jgi:acetate---CoA ligase (ADP-forming)
MLSAKSVAIVGASDRAPWPSRIYANLRDFGYQGQIFLVNPRQEKVYSQRCAISASQSISP